jgi:hypothetical protein
MPAVVFSGPVNVCYGQIFVVSPGCGAVFLENSFKGQVNGICGAKVSGGLMLLCGLHSGRVSLEVSVHASEPTLDGSWSEVAEAPFQFLSKPVVLEDWDGYSICELPIDGPGFMVRWSARRFGEAEEAGRLGDEEPYEQYSLQLWRSATPKERIVKVSTEKAKYWHTHAQSL